MKTLCQVGEVHKHSGSETKQPKVPSSAQVTAQVLKVSKPISFCLGVLLGKGFVVVEEAEDIFANVVCE